VACAGPGDGYKHAMTTRTIAIIALIIAVIIAVILLI
jgi:hypothetical protein